MLICFFWYVANHILVLKWPEVSVKVCRLVVRINTKDDTGCSSRNSSWMSKFPESSWNWVFSIKDTWNWSDFVKLHMGGVTSLTVFVLQTKYTLIDEQDIPLVENYAFEVRWYEVSLMTRSLAWMAVKMAMVCMCNEREDVWCFVDGTIQWNLLSDVH